MSAVTKKIPCRVCSAAILSATAQKHEGLCARCHKQAERFRFLEKHESKPGCPSCDGQRMISFNWRAALERKGHEIDKYPKFLRRERSLKAGFLYRCPVCEARWYLDSREEMMAVVPESRLSLLEEWNVKELFPSVEILKTAQSIGATPINLYGGGSESVCVPCEVLTTGGETFKEAILSFQKAPPISHWSSSVRLLDEVVSIRPSEFALSKQVRYATSQAPEIRMCFSPTLVQSTSGFVFVINGQADFMLFEGVKGKDITLSTATPNESLPLASRDPALASYFVGDWFPHAESLRIKSADL